MKQTPVGVPTIISGTDSIRKQIGRQRDMAGKYAANLSDLQRKHVLEALAEIERTAREVAALVRGHQEQAPDPFHAARVAAAEARQRELEEAVNGKPEGE